jgi:S-adenosylmethionine-diacylglycerol 3-amino-3-carboxypropyl transferase
MSGASIETRASFAFVRYASVWEDADILCEALAPVAPGGRLLSIASAGDNALALLTLDPAEVIAVDISSAQLACVELRIAALRALDDAGLLAFLGVTPCSRRLDTYAALRGALSPTARAFWDSHPRAVSGGVIHAGKFERYLRAFGRVALRLLYPRWKLEQVRKARPPAERVRFYERHWDTPLWRRLFQVFCSRAVLGRFGRDPAFLRHADGAIAGPMLERVRHALTVLPPERNPYLAYVLTGSYPPEALPRYLRPEHTETIRDRLDRIRIARGRVQEVPGEFNGFNLSDVFEYMSEDEHERSYAALLGRAKPGARLAYWNLLVRRACPQGLAGRVRPLETLAAELHARDLAWFYQAFRLEEVAA